MRPVPASGRRARQALRGLARNSWVFCREGACLLSAAALTGWTTTNTLVAITLVYALVVLITPPRSSTAVLRFAPGLLVAALCALSLESWACASVPAGPSTTWLLTGVAYVVLTSLVRGAEAARAALLRRSRPRRTVIVAEGEHGMALAQMLQRCPEYGMEPVAVVDGGEAGVEAGSGLPLPASPADCLQTVRRSAASVLLLAGRPTLSRAELQDLDRDGCQVMFAPEPGDFVQDFVPTGQELGSFPLLALTPSAPRRPWWTVKRVCDVVLASLLLLLCAPVLVACLLAAWVEGGRGVLFRQVRIGMNGRPFEMLKIRTLKQTSAHDSATRWAAGESTRTGPIGGFLRRTSLDELPQLWNVVTGRMSLVGPRPERPYFVAQFSRQIPHYERRHRVPVGITGWAQVHGLRGDTSIAERARLDNYYIDKWSPILDLKIIIRTIGCVFRLGGA
ncbi:sugar transferase [Nonomuraea soli]|uniref:Exopolysaccharide biosynthesis polyprenyl glycosylphosphotransferase n=1 Tax=Nonomuraea soli TaxID=1032476 RepID=A0A7W0CHP4_9ACTN|nr:sugar transferase [Nonomuraea soli]MBA2891396.1 exopolysaccharide biosynthesis polyprenyl glycosylphosphotransferase [Nonomuraea soli]